MLISGVKGVLFDSDNTYFSYWIYLWIIEFVPEKYMKRKKITKIISLLHNK